jgi:Flp pilus assembly protein TadG
MRSQSRRSGFVLVTMAAGALAMTGALGMAFDVGRMYIAKSELQTFADAAALAATLRLNGQASGITRAQAEVDAMRTTHKWKFASASLAANEVTVDFAQSINNGPPVNWSSNPGNPTGYSFTRVAARGSLQIYFMAAVRGATQTSIATTATAGQLQLGPTSVPQGMFPFTPIAHADVKPDFGFEEGKQYTLKWASSPKLNGNNVCQGDRKQALLDASARRGAENRGFYGAGAASVLKDQVANDTPVTYYPEGSNIVLTGGATTTVKDALQTRINQDADHTSTTFAAYKEQGHSRRITTVPVTDSVNGIRIVGFARFFLLPANEYQNAQGNDAWCGIYIGPGAPEGGDTGGANTSASITRVRLWN